MSRSDFSEEIATITTIDSEVAEWRNNISSVSSGGSDGEEEVIRVGTDNEEADAEGEGEERLEEGEDVVESRRCRAVRIAAERSARQVFYSRMLQYNPLEVPDSSGGELITDIVLWSMLFIPLYPLKDLLNLSLVCRQWRFLSNYLPHWSAYRLNVSPVFEGHYLTNRAQFRLRKSAHRKAPRETHTRSDLIRAIDKSQRLRRSRVRRGRIRCVTWQIVHLALLCGLCAACYFICWSMGHTSKKTLDNDPKIATSAFFSMIGVVGVASAAGVFVSPEKEGPIVYRRFTLMAALAALAIFFGPVIGLIGGRTKAAELLVEAGEVTMVELPFMTCEEYDRRIPAAYLRFDTPFASEWSYLNVSSLAPNDLRVNEETNTTFLKTYLGVPYTLMVRPDSDRDPTFSCPKLATAYKVVALLGFNVEPAGRILINNRTALSYRMARASVYYNAAGDEHLSLLWYNANNSLWMEGRVMLLNGGMIETLQDGIDRVDDLYHARNTLLIVLVIILVVWYVVSSLPARCVKCGFYSACIFCMVLLNPITMVIAGILCVLGESKPRFMMCDLGSGVSLIIVGALISGWFFAQFCDDDD